MAPLTAPTEPAPLTRRAPELVGWTGRLPAPLGQYLGRLPAFDLTETYAVVGRFLEVRELINIARRLHQVLERGPHTAASGRWSFEEFMATKAEIERQIRLLHQRVNRAAQDAKLTFPSRKAETLKEEPHGEHTDVRMA